MNVYVIFLLLIAGAIIGYLIINEIINSKKREKRIKEVFKNGNTK